MAINLTVSRTRLLVRMITADDGRVVPLLADSAGMPLPMQRKVSLAYDSDGRAEVTVTFAVDGDEIQLVPDNMRGVAA